MVEHLGAGPVKRAGGLLARLLTCLWGCLVAFGGLFGGLLGCNDVQLNPPTTPGAEPSGTVAGRVCAPTGDAWLEGAYVYTNLVDDSGRISGIRETYTDPDGFFVLEGIPEQDSVTVYIQKGTWQTSLSTVVENGTVTQLEEPPCLDPLSLNAAVVSGDYDSFSVLLEELGVTNYVVVEGAEAPAVASFMGDLDVLLGFDLICLNGGMQEGSLLDDPVNAQNLADYVRAGGTLFVTDWSYDWVERAFPEAIDFLGDDGVADSAQRGVAEVVAGRVVDQALASYLGENEVDLRYDLAFWPVIEGAVSQVVVHVSGDVHYYDAQSQPVTVPGAALLVSFSAGYGSVVYSSFRGESNLTDDTTRILQYMLYKL